MLQAAAQLELLSASEPCCEMQYRRARALVDLSRECAAASRTRCAAMFCKIGQLFSGSGASLNVQNLIREDESEQPRRDHRRATVGKTLAMLWGG